MFKQFLDINGRIISPLFRGEITPEKYLKIILDFHISIPHTGIPLTKED